MISRSLARRLEALEVCLAPATAGEPLLIRIEFVEGDGTVVDHMDVTVPAAPKPPGWRSHPWRRG